MSGVELKVRVVTHGGLGRRSPSGKVQNEIVVQRGMRLAEVLTLVGIHPGLVGVMSSDGRLMTLETALENDCNVEVYPIVGGG